MLCAMLPYNAAPPMRLLGSSCPNSQTQECSHSKDRQAVQPQVPLMCGIRAFTQSMPPVQVLVLTQPRGVTLTM